MSDPCQNGCNGCDECTDYDDEDGEILHQRAMTHNTTNDRPSVRSI